MSYSCWSQKDDSKTYVWKPTRTPRAPHPRTNRTRPRSLKKMTAEVETQHQALSLPSQEQQHDDVTDIQNEVFQNTAHNVSQKRKRDSLDEEVVSSDSRKVAQKRASQEPTVNTGNMMTDADTSFLNNTNNQQQAHQEDDDALHEHMLVNQHDQIPEEAFQHLQSLMGYAKASERQQQQFEGKVGSSDPNLDPSFASLGLPQNNQAPTAPRLVRGNSSGSKPGTTSSNTTPAKPTVGSDEWHRQRKDNHKEVERRRRETINEGINELAKIVPNCEKNKGSILASAVHYIMDLKQTEAANIEKWTLEKLLTEQAINELSATNDKLKADLERAWREAETWKKACASAGLPTDRPANATASSTS